MNIFESIYGSDLPSQALGYENGSIQVMSDIGDRKPDLIQTGMSVSKARCYSYNQHEQNYSKLSDSSRSDGTFQGQSLQ